jgi:hypothetical protein
MIILPVERFACSSSELNQFLNVSAHTILVKAS